MRLATYIFVGFAAMTVGCDTAAEGDKQPKPATEPPCSDTPWVNIEMATGMACGVHVDGCAECWGWEDWGDTASDPVDGWDTGGGLVDYNTQFPPDETFASISLAPWSCMRHFPGSYTSCGLTVDGRIVCWGPEDFGAPSDGTWSELVVDSRGVCALSTTGALNCWGPPWAEGGFSPPSTSGLQGLAHQCELAVGLQSDGLPWYQMPDDRWAPFLPAGPLRRIGVSDYFVCYEDQEHTVACMNTDSGAALFVPEPVQRSGDVISRLAVAGLTACVLTSEGWPVCWSIAGEGHEYLTSPDGEFVDISIGASGPCALTADGRAGCWSTFDGDVTEFRPPGSYVAF